jgi:hypothetical protein
LLNEKRGKYWRKNHENAKWKKGGIREITIVYKKGERRN